MRTAFRTIESLVAITVAGYVYCSWDSASHHELRKLTSNLIALHEGTVGSEFCGSDRSKTKAQSSNSDWCSNCEMQFLPVAFV